MLLFKPIFQGSAHVKDWLLLSLSSTLAGNLTIVGSMANKIVVEGCQPEVKIGFWQYLRTGFWVTLLTIIVGVLWLTLIG
jgi:Na+/H+ antiporter NhaD/arsenite permease-like protein